MWPFFLFFFFLPWLTKRRITLQLKRTTVLKKENFPLSIPTNSPPPPPPPFFFFFFFFFFLRIKRNLSTFCLNNAQKKVDGERCAEFCKKHLFDYFTVFFWLFFFWLLLLFFFFFFLSFFFFFFFFLSFFLSCLVLNSENCVFSFVRVVFVFNLLKKFILAEMKEKILISFKLLQEICSKLLYCPFRNSFGLAITTISLVWQIGKTLARVMFLRKQVHNLCCVFPEKYHRRDLWVIYLNLGHSKYTGWADTKTRGI